MVTLYVLKGGNGMRYVGITNDLTRRLRDHNHGKTKGGQILGSFQVIHTERHLDHAAAREREVFLKSGQGRKWLNKLESENAKEG